MKTKTLTAKQRGEVYFKAAEFLFDSRTGNLSCCCDAIQIVTDADIGWREVPYKMKELQLFSPTKYNYTGFWWEAYNETGNNERIIALLFCYQMTKYS